MPSSKLDDLLNDLDATLNDMQIQRNAEQMQQQILRQQQEQLRLQQQLIEVQTALLKQQQMAAVSAASFPRPAIEPPSTPHAGMRGSSDSLIMSFVPYSTDQVQRDQLAEYNRSLRLHTSTHDRTTRKSFSDDSAIEIQSISSASIHSAGISGGGVFGSKAAETASMTSSEKKRSFFSGLGMGKKTVSKSSSPPSSIKKKEDRDVLATLESVGF
ncbi:hypothetical protein BC830DRAFT_1114202 [Chytriomyces sp. MP71]|nr:hypothetical protein BC830DRAFT_1114202 [Chytriomyces sp. MP71]